MSEGKNGVFENLPRRRPALRTPRRDRRREEASFVDRPSSIDEHPMASDEGRGTVDDESGFGAKRRAEDLTLAGIGAAADAVVLGLKLIERAYGGVRGTVNRH